MQIRDLTPADLPAVLVLNNDAAPAVNELDEAGLAWLFERSAQRLGVVTPEGDLVAFCLALEPGVPYESLNYRWFSERYRSFTYLDRIVVAPTHRRLGIGDALYGELEERSAPSSAWLLCEVNLRPANEGSLRFHRTIGFAEVGRQDTEGGTKTVCLMAKPL